MNIPDPRRARRLVCSGQITGHTSGVAPGCLLGDVAILAAECAVDFARFCYCNPRPCPLVGVFDTGDTFLPAFDADSDLLAVVQL